MISKDTYEQYFETHEEGLLYFETFFIEIFIDKLTMKSTIYDIEEFFDRKATIKDDLNSRLNLSPDKEFAFDQFIKNERAIVDGDEDVIKGDRDSLTVSTGYQYARMGMNIAIEDFLNYFFEEELDNEGNNILLLTGKKVMQVLSDIAEGVALAFVLPEFEKNRENIVKHGSCNESIWHIQEVIIASTNILAHIENMKKSLNAGIAGVRDITSSINEHETPNSINEEYEHILSHKAIALIHVYLSESKEGRSITRQNRDQIAVSYGYNSPTSGRSIYDEFRLLKDVGERLATNNNDKRSINARLSYFQTAIEHLQQYPKALKMAQDELKTFQSKL